jgi:iron complex transport system ATP-binding protein
MPLLQVQDIRFQYGSRLALRDVFFDIGVGEVVGIIGPNGSGKTTLLKIIDGLMTPQSGDILIGGINIRAMKRSDLAKMISIVPQESYSIFPFSVEEIVLMGRSPHLGKFQFESRADYEIARQAMAMTDTLDYAGRKIQELSGGERQRVWIARALAQEPKILLLDEFTAFLDMRHQIALFDLMTTLNRSRNLTVLIATHDINMIAQYAQRLIMLHKGSIHAMGTPEAVITHDNILTVYETHVLIDRHPTTGSPRLTKMSNLT